MTNLYAIQLDHPDGTPFVPGAQYVLADTDEEALDHGRLVVVRCMDRDEAATVTAYLVAADLPAVGREVTPDGDVSFCDVPF